MSNVELRMVNERSGDSRSDKNGTFEGTLYIVLGTSYKFLLLDTRYLILFLISNVELRLLNEEVRIRFKIQKVLLKDLCTWYLVQLRDSCSDSNGTSEDTLYIVLGTSYIVLPVINYFHKTPFFFSPNKLQFCSKSSWNGCLTSTPETFTSR